MFRICVFSLVLAATATVPFVTGTAQAAAPKPATQKQMKEWEQTTKEVWEKLLAKANATQKSKPKNWEKVHLLIVDGIPQRGKEPLKFNACATTLDDGTPVVYITLDYIEAYEGHADALAYVLGHELGHHFLNHVSYEGVHKTQTKADIDQRRKEADADLFGAKLLLQCGYSLKEAIRFDFEVMKRRKLTYSSAEGSWRDHPGESDRMARIATLVNENEETLWRNMSAFENGVYFLSIEDFTAAEACFERVTKEFPNCAEAWANLGMARLMKYFDRLDVEQLRRLDIGQFVSGIRFRYAQLNGREDKMKWFWLPAEVAFLQAYKLKPKSATILVGLGLLYLTCPERTDKRMVQAEEFLGKAYALAATSESDLEPEALAALLINRGVVRMAKGDTDDGQGLIEKADKVGMELKGGDAVEVKRAVMFNTAVAQRARGKNKLAIATYKSYLTSVPSSNPWWGVAYQAYVELQMADGVEPAKAEKLAPKTNPIRTVMAVKLANGKIVHIGESVKDVRDKLGTPDQDSVDAESGLCTLTYPSLGVTFITDSEEVVGMTLSGEHAPVIVVKEKGPNGKVLGEVHVGMTRDEVQKNSGVKDWISRRFTNIAADRSYPYSPSLGVAVIYGKGKQSETVVGILIGSIQTAGEEVVAK